MLRLLLLSTEFPPGPGGIGTHACQLAANLVREGWEIVVLTPQDYMTDADIEAFNAGQSFKVVRFDSRGTLARKAIDRFQKAARWIRAWKPDVLIGTGSRQVWVTCVLAKIFRKPWLAVGHGTEFGLVSSWERKITRWAFQQANAVVCVSLFTRRYMQNAGIHPRTDVVIPNGADSSRFHRMAAEDVQAFRAAHRVPEGRLLVTVGNVTERKGQDVVIHALPSVLQQISDVHYLVVGLPTQLKAFSAIAIELGVADHVHFLGRVDPGTLPGYLNAADLFVMTSRHTATGECEGYGIAAVEAALCGKPAVVSADSGLAEAVIHDVTGLHVPQDDPMSTARAITSLLANTDKLQQMGEAAYLHAVGENTWEHIAHRYHEVLRRVVRRNGDAK